MNFRHVSTLCHICCSECRYCMSLENRPIVTKACTSLVGFMLGDLLAQKLEGDDLIDMARVMRLGAYGVLLDGPVGHMWYKCVPCCCLDFLSVLWQHAAILPFRCLGEYIPFYCLSYTGKAHCQHIVCHTGWILISPSWGLLCRCLETTPPAE